MPQSVLSLAGPSVLVGFCAAGIRVVHGARLPLFRRAHSEQQSSQKAPLQTQGYHQTSAECLQRLNLENTSMLFLRFQ
ncbi:hypothetical protein IscW_ISCW020195 [Ixodes scapularis]|uniref:Uncharacterized protein n=1 Tax=Ixodes scapularis TaxID=6945 RepID=B7Q0D3_IXOSC|nr:hypothetical protein IscW_ISCW020195 [Ixodes scapularis]|eukprot:XP_002407462.1 hypothetical protein IscW_ISCW020195 [Ixodes scapularis]